VIIQVTAGVVHEFRQAGLVCLTACDAACHLAGRVVRAQRRRRARTVFDLRR
jgi:hypothetical protein